MYSPKFSIIIPIYNTEKYLKTCVDSILTQSYDDFELWLIDDGSKDKSRDIIKDYESKDSRIKTGFIRGSGPAEPRNYGLRRAKGKYILFVDSDDYLTEGSLQVFNDYTEKFPEADFIRGNQRILIDNIREATSVFAENRSKFANQILKGEDFLVDVLQRDYAPIDALFKTEFLKSHKIEFHEELIILEDGPFISEICAETPLCLYINEETYVYRLFTPGSATNSPVNLKKTLSLIRSGKYYLNTSKKFGKRGAYIMKERASDHAVSGMYQALNNLSPQESKIVYNELANIHPKLAPFSSYNKGHLIFMKTYNFSHKLSFYLLKIYIKLQKLRGSKKIN